MASARKPSRAPNNTETPRPQIPSRTSSLKHFRSGCSDEKGKPTIGAFSAAAKALGETLALSSTSKSATQRQGLKVDDSRSLEFLNKDPAAKLSRTYSSRRSLCIPPTNRRSASCSATSRNAMRGARVQRWAGLTRTVSDWDGLRRDPELWFEDADDCCLVHLYAKGASRRGPSFCVPFRALRQKKCGAMFSLCFAQITPVAGAGSQTPSRVSSGFSTPVSKATTVELYIPAPEDASREASCRWHITTRNFFAFVFGKPLVGTHMGETLVELQERMHLFRSGQIDNHKDFLDYAENQGYRDLVDCTDYALAMLHYAEHYKLRDVWIDAFSHCVGMNDSLSLSQEFAPISRLTKALITRAYLEMDIALGRVSDALSNFLEDDLSPVYLGLSDGARTHLDRFRSFFHGFYVEKFGYWPPPKGASYSKALYKSMYFDFKNLYDYLVDSESTADISLQKPASGGICVLQNVDTFDKRHKFTPLPHPLPLLPNYEPLKKKTESQKALRSLTLGSKQAKTDRYLTMRAALTSATNSDDFAVTNCSVVQAYMRFEQQYALNQREERVSMADARKVRWLLIYGTLQYLVSALRAPKEVRDTDGPDYPLCCLVTEQSPWQVGIKALTSPLTASVNIPEAINNYLTESSCADPSQLSPGTPQASTIQPDCQTDDYFTHTNPDATPSTSRPISVEMPAPLRISPSRNSSVRSFKRLSLSRQNSRSRQSSRRNSITLKSSSHCEIIVHGYGNGLNNTVVDPPSRDISRRQSVNHSQRSSKSTLPEGAGPDTSWLRDSSVPAKRPSDLEINCDIISEQARTPIIDSFQMDQMVSPITSDELQDSPSSSGSTRTAESPFWSDDASSASSKSSANDAPLERKTSAAEQSGLLGGLVPMGSTPVPVSKRRSSSLTRTLSRRGEFRFSFGAAHIDISQTSPTSFIGDPTIGVALSDPLQPSDRSSVQKSRPLSRSFSTESIPLSKHIALSSLQMNSISPPQKQSGGIDIFAAVSSGPTMLNSEDKEINERRGSETSRSILNAIPPPIAKSKAPQSSKKTSQSKSKVLEDEERGRKKERRKSLFWRR